MYIYEQEIVIIDGIEKTNIIAEMNKFGIGGWDIFNISEKTLQITKYGEVYEVLEYTLYMKKFNN